MVEVIGHLGVLTMRLSRSLSDLSDIWSLHIYANCGVGGSGFEWALDCDIWGRDGGASDGATRWMTDRR